MSKLLSPSKGFTFDLQRFVELTNFTQEDGVYLIKTAEDLANLATFVNDGGDTSGLTFKLTADIEDFTSHIGDSEAHKFKGTLDGNKHKISVNYSSTTENCALFNYVEGATIQNLIVDGTINTSAKYAAGIVAQTSGTTNITDCRSSVTINSTVSGDGTHGGLVAGVSGTTNISNSIFNGKLLGSSTNKCGGFVGWRSGTLNISKSLFAPAEVTIGASGSATFARNGVNSLTGGYYTQIFNDAQGGSQVYEITLPEGVTTDDAHTFGGKNYINEHSTLSYNNTLYQLDATGAVTITIDGGKLLANGTELEVSFLNTVEKDGDSYLIKSLEELNGLATYVNAGNDCAGLTFKLDADIANFTEHIGTSTTHFKGTLDGDGHKISVNYSSNTENCAVFNYVEGATIQNLIVDGTINTSAKYAAGIVAQTSGTTNITDCCSSVTINSTVSGDGTHGGLVAAVVSGGTLNITNSIFNGKLLGESTDRCGGFVGYKGGTLNISNSLFAPAEVTIGTSGSATFARNGVNSLTGGYYTQTFNDAQNGTQIYTLTLPDKVSATCTNANDYEITFNGKNYYKAGATFTLTVTDAPENMTIKGATKDKDGTYSYTLDGSAELKWLTTITWSEHTEDLPEAVDGVITITTAGQLAKLAELVNGGTFYEGTTIKLGNDIDLSAYLWTAIGKSWDIGLKGTFDGDGHTISGLTINAETQYQGLFGAVYGGTIKNVNLTGVNVTSTKSYVGGLVGCVYNGSVENCTVSGKVEDTGDSSQHIGGLAGEVYNATAKNNLVFDATVSGKFYYIGAVIGHLNNGTVTNNLYYSITDDRKGVGKFSNGSEDNGTAPAYKLTLPEGVKVMDGGVKFGDYWYVAQGATINLTAADEDKGLQSITIDGETLTSVTGIIPYKVTGDKTFTNAELGDPPITEFTAENDKTISLVSGLAETINVADSVTSFSISGNLDTDDRIIFAKSVTSLENINGGFVAHYEDGAVSIGGLPAQTVGKWSGANYRLDTLAGAIIGTEGNESVVKWAEATNASSAEFTIWYPATTDENSLKANVSVDTTNNVISLTPAVLRNKESNNSFIDSTKYQIVIVEDSGRTNTKAFAGGFNSPGTITNHAANMFIERSKDSWYDAKDSITNTADSVTIDAGYGNDTISNIGSNVSIFGGTDKDYYGNDSPGNDVINNSGSQVTIDAGAGKDTVTNSGSNVTIDAGAGDDLIVNTAASGVTITTGDGSDVISIGADVKSFAVTDELSTNDRIVFAGGSISSLTTTEDNVVIATVGNQVVSIEGFPHVSSNEATWNRDTETNIAQYVPAIYSASLSSDNSAIIVKAEGQGEPLIELGGIVNTDAFTTDTKNKIVSMPFSSSVMSGEGASILSNRAGYAVKLTGGDVNKFYGSDAGDSITNDGNNGRTIFGGAGNDSLVDTGSQNTLHGGEGNDTLVHENSYASTLNGEAGDDLIVIKGTGANLASHVYTGEGNDSVSIGANVQMVVLEDFSPNDKIIFEKKVASIVSGALGYNDYTGITATYEDGKTVKIAGVHVPQIGEWIDGAFYNNTPQGAQVSTETIDGEEKSVITVTAAIGGTRQFEIYNGGWFYNLTNNSTVDIANKTATFNPAAFRNLSDDTRTYIHSNAENYQFVIANDDNANREVTKSFGHANAFTNDTITNHAQNMFIDGGNGADSLINDASNVSMIGGAGDDVIELGGGSNISISLGDGKDTIKVGSAVKAFTVEDFSMGDAIEFAESVSVDSMDGGFIATFGDGSAVSIGGISLAGYDDGAWSLKDSVASYGKTYLAGNQLSDDGKTITYGKNKLSGDAQVAISGVKAVPTLEGNTVKISSGNAAGNIQVESNAKSYAFELSGEAYATFITNSIDDSITNLANNLTIQSGAGSDTVVNTGFNVLIDGDAGDDDLGNGNSNVTINGGAGNDVITNLGSNVKIDAGDDGDYIANYKNYVSINGADGDDTIINYDEENMSADNVTIDGGLGNDYIYNASEKVTINAGEGADSIGNVAASVLINGGDDADYIENYGANTSINAGDGANYIENYGANTSINAGDGNDIIFNFAQYDKETHEVITSPDNVLIESGAGDDTIAAEGSNVTMIGGEGADYIAADGEAASINGGEGSNTIELNGNNATVNVADGDDLISLGANVTALKVEGFGVGDSIELATAAELTIDGGKLIAGEVSIAGISSVATVNNKWSGLTYQEETVAGAKLDDKVITYDTVSGSKDLFTINGLKDTTGVEIDGAQVILTDAAFANRDKETITLTDKDGDANYKFALAENSNVKTSKESVTAGTFAAKDGEHVYSTATYGEWYSVGDTSITYNASIDSKNYTISGLSSAASADNNVTIEEGDDKITFTFKAAALNKNSVEITGGDNVAIVLAQDVDTDKGTTHSEQININDGTLTYTATNTNAYYSVNGAKVIYTSEGDSESFTLSGLKKSLAAVDNKVDGVTISGNTVTVDESALDMAATEAYTVKLVGDFTLNFNANTSDAEIPATLENGNYTSAYTPAYFTGNGKEYTFTPATAPTTFTISGLGDGAKLGENVIISNKTIQISSGALTSSHEKISVDDSSYTLQLNDSLVADIPFAQDGNKVTLSGTTEGYKLINGSYEWQAQVDGEELTTTGLKSDATLTEDMFTRDGDKIVFKPSDELLPENPTEIKISSGVIDTSELATTEAVAAYWDGTSYISAKTASSWATGASSVEYTAATGGEKLFTLSGAIITGNIDVDTDNKIVTLTADNLDKKAVSVEGDYTLTLSGVTTEKPATTTTAKFGSVSSGKATYTQTATTAEYWAKAADSKSYTFTAQDIQMTDLFTLSGIKSTSGIAVDASKKAVTLKAANLNNKNVTFSANAGGYTMALNSNVDTTAENISKWTTLKSGNVAYQADGTGSYYSLNKAKTAITYNASVAGANKIELSGVKGTPTLSGSTVKLTANNFNSNVTVASNAGGYTLALSGDFKNKTLTGTTGADKINSSGSNLVISGGKGNDTATLGTNNTFLYAKGDGNDILYSFGNDDKIKLTGTTKAQTSVSGKDVIVTTDGGKITVKDAAQGNIVTILNDKDSVISAYTYSTDKIVDGKLGTLTSAFKGTFNAKNFTKVDGSAVVNAIKITGGSSASTLTGGTKNDSIAGGKANDKLYGNAGNDSLSGGAGNDTLSGGAGNDKLLGGAGNDSLVGGDGADTLSGNAGNDKLTGGKGNDTFVFSGGKDTITDYAAGDKVSVASSLGKGKFSVSKKNVIMTYGSNTLTITNGLDKEITFINGATGTYKTAGIFNKDNTAVTLPAATKTFDATKYSALVTVDASAANSTIKITGNAKANVLTAGANGSTLSGGKGKDTLNGGAGKDSLVGGADNDKLLGNAGNDTLSGGDGADTLSGGTGNDKLLGGKGNDSLVGGDGADTLSGDAGNDKLTGGKGNDTFVFSGGKDTITDYAAGDKVSVASSLGKGKFSVSKKNVIMTYGSNTLTITNGLNKEITFINGATGTYKTAGIFNKDNTAVTLPAATKTFDATKYSALVTVDASAANSTIKITGNAKANVLTAGANGSTLSGGKGKDTLNGGAGKDSLVGGVDNDKLLGNAGNDTLSGGDGADTLSGGAGNDKLYGGKGNDSLWGGAGNDSLWGGAGKDVFVYKPNEGTDTIFDYASGDMLKILKTNGKEGGSFTKSSFSNNKLTLTISGGGSVVFDGVKSGDAFNINGTTHTISGKKLK